MDFFKPYRFLAVALSILVVFSTLSVSVHKHFCGKSLIDTALFKKAKSCCNLTLADTENNEKSCCSNEVSIKKGANQLVPITIIDVVKPLKVTAIFGSLYYKHILPFYANKRIPHKNYKPPALVYNYQSLLETYRI